MPQIHVDGVEYEVEEGRTLLQALDDLGLLMNGVDIPHYCWHPKLSIDGSCRLCQVEVEGLPKLQIACNTKVQDGMVVHTQTEKVRRARETVMELLLVNHPLDCPICDQAGECKLQDYAVQYGRSHARTREPRRPGRKRVALGPEIVFDEERCILCRRCVRFCREIPGTGELAVEGRGDRSVIATFPGETLDNPYSMNVADICPVGALTTRDFRFKVRVWFLEDVPGICTGCAKGCNVNLGVAKGAVQRLVPRRNDAVNDTWICDAGRLSYHEIASPARIEHPALREAGGRLVAATLDDAVTEAAARLRRAVAGKGPGVVGALASPHASNEDLYQLRCFLQGLGSEVAGMAVVTGAADDLLVQPEKAANATGARALGFGPAGGILDRVRGGGLDALIVLGHDVLETDLQGDAQALAGLGSVILLDTHRSKLESVAHVVLPTLHAAEKLGTYTNHAGRVQRMLPAAPPPFPAWSEGDLLLRLGRALELPECEGSWSPESVSLRMSEAVPAFAGVHLGTVGALGMPLAELPA